MYHNLIIKSGRSLYSVPIDAVVFLEKDMRKIRVHTRRSIKEFYGKFNEIYRYLDGRFMHCHRSYIINMDEIVRMEGRQIVVSTGDRIVLGRDTYSRARKAYESYITRAERQTDIKN